MTRPAVSIAGALSDQEKGIAKSLAQASHHPLSRALVAALPEIAAAKVQDIKEIPGQGVEGEHNGQVVRLGRGAWIDAPFEGFGLKIGAAPAHPFEASETLREGVSDAISRLKLPCEIVTGDTEAPARQVAQQLDLPVTFSASPEDKFNHLNDLADAGHNVLMIGDGLNDTAALASAHASIAPSTALEASRNAADIVALKESFADLPLVVAVAHASSALSKQNFAIATLYNFIAVPIALAGFATPLAAALAMSVSSITVLLNSQRMRFVQ